MQVLILKYFKIAPHFRITIPHECHIDKVAFSRSVMQGFLQNIQHYVPCNYAALLQRN